MVRAIGFPLSFKHFPQHRQRFLPTAFGVVTVAQSSGLTVNRLMPSVARPVASVSRLTGPVNPPVCRVRRPGQGGRRSVGVVTPSVGAVRQPVAACSRSVGGARRSDYCVRQAVFASRPPVDAASRPVGAQSSSVTQFWPVVGSTPPSVYKQISSAGRNSRLVSHKFSKEDA